MKVLIEQQIIKAVRKLLTGQVNDFLGDSQFSIPVIEFGVNGSGYTIAPAISLIGCEGTEKERIVKQDTYLMTITFSFQEQTESELHLYAYSGAVSRVFCDNPTLGGIADRTVITGKKYLTPKKQNCGESYALIVSLRVTVEGLKNESPEL